ncbi:nucleoside deaminase [Haloarcula sp. S1CR25-12]|uniref:Nucleoside deaminase n=1 Tax=Haloarcula saliterrae TaxID=2950534 RepID=A0ABU2FFU3_9EURY|nr:nucleoside deaminase [Haloarcula sp. S1CR25-12]MDS0261134.1 nucleoside deaminase [Haloarcula sp. S1CR25-12]
MVDIEALDHEKFTDRACDLARIAGERGDGPYGSLLVVDGEIIMEETNREVTDDDLSLHPELTLARRAAQELDEETAREAVMYTSTEPCPMCSTGMAYAGLGAVVYSVSGERASELRGGGTGGIPSDEVFDRLDADIEVIGPVLQTEGEAVHEAF